jgi:hypothetical protein
MVALRRDLPHERPHVERAGSPARPWARPRRPAAGSPGWVGLVPVSLSVASAVTALVLSWALWVTAARSQTPVHPSPQVVRTP